MARHRNPIFSFFTSCSVHVFCCSVIVSQIACISILEHVVEPPVVTNCTSVTLTCRLDTGAPSVEVWWTFKGENASKLPDMTFISDNADIGEWKLEIKCPTLEHKGNYACNAQVKNESEVVYRKEALLRIYVPVSIELENNVTSRLIGGKVNLTCLVTAHPLAAVEWLENGNVINTTADDRVQASVADELDGVTELVSLSIENLQRSDNGTYICQASNEFTNASASQTLLVEEPPEVEFLPEKVFAENPGTVLLQWHTIYDGNLPMSRFRLYKESILDPDLVEVNDDLYGNVTSYTIDNLLPGITYRFRLSASNDAGTSDWIFINISMPSDVPPRVSWVHVLASTNETLLFGWRRPTHDNGANITHYTVQLHHNNSLIANETMEIQQPGRNNLMYIFVLLEPGETYSFQVQACSSLGCGNWSDPLDGTTSDGIPDAPRNVELKCGYDFGNNTDFITVTWETPFNARGTIVGYNITMFSKAEYRSDNGQIIEEKLVKKEIIDVKAPELMYKLYVLPNTEYTVQTCTINRSGCGPMTNVTPDTRCMSFTNVPSILPQFSMQRKNNSSDCQQLELKLHRVSERNGSILCYKVVMIKLPEGQDLSKLPNSPEKLNLSTHEKVHKNGGFGAYVAEAFTSDEFVSEVVIGDNRQSYCDSPIVTDKKRHIIHIPENKNMQEIEYVQDGSLAPRTNYTGYILIRVQGPNNTILTKTSPYFQPPILTGSPPPPTSTESPMLIILGISCGVILVVISTATALLLIRHKHGNHYMDNGERLGLTALILRTIHRNGHLPRGKGGALSKVPRTGLISRDELPAAFIERHVDSDLLFQSEFESLPESFKDRTTHSSDAPENLNKNRYPDIKAYDQTRVRLPVLDGVPGSDYINANFIEGYKGRKTFICAQGPLDRTVTDFWRMLWEHRVTVVVMLTGIEEHGQVKCSQYWNDSCAKEIEKMFVVTVISTKRYSDYIVRRFQVEYTKDGMTEEREVLHFHFVLWKDFLAPEQPSWLLRFIKRVNEHYCSDRGPLLVHCSAGVGRTGTFVAIDSLLQQLEEDGRIDIFAHVTTLRYQRNFLVQSLKQFIFVYRALMEHAQFGDTEIEIRHLRDHYELLKEKVGDTDKTGLAIEFEKLGDVIEDAKTCCVGTMDMNISKNRYDFIIPYDLNRVILPPSPSRDHSSYINASFIQGYDRSLSFIITQDPLEVTAIEFWRMIKEQCITTLVMLSEIGEGQTKCQPYWPSEGEEKICDYIKVTFENSEKYPYYSKREFSVLNTKNNDKHNITQFQFQEWPCSAGTVPEGTNGLVTLIEDVQHNQEKHISSGPITVHCSGGGDRSSVFVTLSVLIQQLKAEERVDIFQAARYTRSQRHCMLQTLAQYDFLYRGLLEYIISRNLCDMGDTQL